MKELLFLSVLLLLGILSFKSSKSVSTGSDYSLAGKNFNMFTVGFTIVGTLVGGASTVGTVQMAYEYGISSIIFTFGSSLACIILALFFCNVIRKHNIVTINELLGLYFGSRIKKYSSLFSIVGVLIHIVGQLLASIAIFISVFNVNIKVAGFICSVLLFIFSIAGGMKSSSIVSKYKTFMIYTLLIASILSVIFQKNFSISNLLYNLENKDWYNIFAYGKTTASKDIISMIIGVISTQTYIQIILSAKNLSEAKKGALFAAIIIPPIGLAGFFIGSYMRVYHPDISATSSVLPYFIFYHFNPILASIFTSFLMVISLGTASGLMLGAVTNIYEDFIKNSQLTDKIEEVTLYRIIGLIIIMFTFTIFYMDLFDKILTWSFISMGLRGSAIFIPLLLIILVKKNLNNNKIKFIIYAAPILYIAAAIFL